MVASTPTVELNVVLLMDTLEMRCLCSSEDATESTELSDDEGEDGRDESEPYIDSTIL